MTDVKYPLLVGGEGYTRVAEISQGGHVYWEVLEYPPAFRSLKVWNLPFTLKLIMPYTYFFVRMYGEKDQGGYVNSGISVFFARKPLESPNDNLYVPFLPHFTTKGELCADTLSLYTPTSPLQGAVGIVNHFWSEGFGIMHNKLDLLMASDWRVRNPYRWALLSRMTPQSVLELEMRYFASAGSHRLKSGDLYLPTDFYESLKEV
ncbi:MAG: hypothetical protein Q7S53_00535 [bacterium]|nr:hypothetical protein [bacterium]